jgi:ribosome-binding factor A
MIKTVEGVFRNGKIELFEVPKDLQEARVYVTFLPAKNEVELREVGIDEQQAADLRWRLQAFATDWERPEMDVYDDL